MQVKPKKHLGQHFLTDKNIAKKITDSLLFSGDVLEIGPGKGILTEILLNKFGNQLKVIDIDKESIEYLNTNFKINNNNIIEDDVLKINLTNLFSNKYAIIGNFPYNISSQIFFKIIENNENINEVVCMIQKEVAERICETHGSRTYGILSVILQAFFDIKYLFTVNEKVFFPPPKVKSAVIRLTKKNDVMLISNKLDFINVIKTAFNQRRKTLTNSLKSFNSEGLTKSRFANMRPEQLSWQDFDELTRIIYNKKDYDVS